jgi:cation diffusion facilitator family transporter
MRLRLKQRWAAQRWARAAWHHQCSFNSAAAATATPRQTITGSAADGAQAGDHRRPARVPLQPSVSISPSWYNTRGPRITLIGTVANLGLVGVKAGAGAISGSSAMVADAAHSLGDLLSDAVALGALRIASKPPDEDHPYGHGKFESVGALAVSGLLLATGIGVGAHSMDILSELFLRAPSATAVPHEPFIGVAVAAAGGSVLVKEWLYRATHKVGVETGSPMLVANAVHHRSDALSSIVALGGIVGTLGGLPWLDPVAGMVVGLMIVRSGVNVGLEATQQLTDTADSELVARVSETMRDFIAEGHGVIVFSHLRARKNGASALVDMHIVVNPFLTVSAAHVLAELVRHRVVSSVPEVVDVTVHVDPEVDEDELSQEDLRLVCGRIGFAHDVHGERDGELIVGPKMIEELVRKTILEEVADVKDVTHVAVHVFKSGVATEVTIEVDPHRLVSEACDIAAAARVAVERIHGVRSADIHLELEDE